MLEKYERLNRERNFPDNKRRVAAYCRVSTDCEDQSSSFESQRRYFRQYIEQHPDWELYEIFADEGISGTNTKKRREFNRMIECAKNGDFDLIITKEISRFARNTLDSIYYTRDLKKHGVGVIFMNDGIDTMDGDAELRLAIMSSIAQEESRKTSERVKWGQKRRMESGVVFGRSMLGYDVKNGKITVNEEGARVVRLIFHKFADEGKGTQAIARELLEEGIMPMRAREWQSSVILRIIRNEKYCGDLVQKKTYTPDFLSHEKKYNHGQEEFIIIKDHHEPIISRELFEKANRILDGKSLSQNGKSKHSSRYPFSGKIKCGICGAGYVARYRTRKNGSRYKTWRCYEAVKHGTPHTDKAGNTLGCPSCAIRNEDAAYLMSLIFRELKYDRRKIADSLIKTIETVVSADFMKTDCPDTTDTEPNSLIVKIKDTENKRTRLIELYTGGDIDKNEFKVMRAMYDKEIEELRAIAGGDMNEQSAAIDGQRQNASEERPSLIYDIRKTVWELIDGTSYEDDFYGYLLDKMVIRDKNHIDVYLNMLPHRWSFRVISGASLPISLSTPAILGSVNENFCDR